jgi:hypothetical protein
VEEGYNPGWGEGYKREIVRLLREEIKLLERIIADLRGVPKYQPTIGVSVDTGPLLVPVRR